MIARLACVALALLVATQAPAQPGPDDPVAGFRGSGTATLPGSEVQIQGLLYAQQDNGRLQFQSTWQNGGNGIIGIGFIGTRSRRSTAQQFVLDVDAMAVAGSAAPGSPSRIEARGTCVLTMANARQQIRNLTCDTQTGMGRFQLRFSGTRLNL